MPSKLHPLITRAGIQRDGTQYSSRLYTDGQWVRFVRSLPRKIGGYKRLVGTLANIVRTIYIEPVSSYLHVYLGTVNKLQYLTLNLDGTVAGALVDRTPAAYVPNANSQWTIDSLFVSVSNKNNIFAHAAQNLSDIDADVETPVYYGETDSVALLTSTGQTTSGGIVALPPYLVLYGKDGTLKITNINDPTTLLSTTRVTDFNIIKGAQVRGGNSSPAGLFWSLNSVVRMTQAGANSAVDFRFDTLTDESSILSSRCVIEYDSKYFWIGVDKFYVYNGVVQELPNTQNSDLFFDNINISQRQKVWATKVPRFGEIWWFYPSGTATECNRAVIFNVNLNTWYDTDIERAAGFYPQVLPKPIWSGNSLNADTLYDLWLHESGKNECIDGVETAIESFYETSEIAYAAMGPDGQWDGTDKWVSLKRMEPDFKNLSGDMTFTVRGREYAQSSVVDSTPYTFSPTTTKIDMNGGGEQRRFMTLKFSSNEVDGYYEAGQIIINATYGDGRQ